jgi:hypothetical protein
MFLAAFAAQLFGACGPATTVTGPNLTPRPSVTASTGPQETAAGPPVMVVQAITDFQDSSDWRGVVVNAEASLAATFGPELAVLGLLDGSLRAEFDGCAIDAVFLSEDEMLVVTCPQAPSVGRTRATPTTEVVRFRLDEGTSTPFSKGPFDRVSLSADGLTAVLRGHHTARVVRLEDSQELHTLRVAEQDDAEVLEVARDGSRALVKERDRFVISKPDGTRVELSGNPFGELSPDLRRRAHDEQGRVLIHDVETGALLSETVFGPKLWFRLAFEPMGERLLVSVAPKGDDESVQGYVQLLRPGGRLGCRVTVDEQVNRLQWSRDGTRFGVLHEKEGARLSVYEAETCARLSTSPSFERYRSVVNDSLIAISPNAKALSVLVPGEPKARTVPFQDFPRLSSWSGAYRLEGTMGSLRYDPLTATVHTVEEPPLLRGSSGVLSVEGHDGSVTAVRGSIPEGVGGLFLLAPDGKRTQLAKSAPFVAGEYRDGFRRDCWQDASGTNFACSQLSEESPNQRVAAWDASGRRLFEMDGTFLTFSPDGKHAHVLSFYSSTDRIVETRTGRVLASRESIAHDPVFFDPSGSFVAFSSLGLLEAKTGAVVAFEGRTFDRWLRSNPRAITVLRGELQWEPHSSSMGSFGPLDVVDTTSQKVLFSFPSDATVVDESVVGNVLLTRDAVDLYRVRDATTFEVRHAAHAYNGGRLSPDGKFVLLQGRKAITITRLADGAEIHQLPPREPGQVGLTYTSDGLYDGGEAALALVRYRVGSAATGKLVSPAEVDVRGHRPGLAKDFFEGKDIARP